MPPYCTTSWPWRMSPLTLALALIFAGGCKPGNIVRGDPHPTPDEGPPGTAEPSHPANSAGSEDAGVPWVMVPLEPTAENSSGITTDGTGSLILDGSGAAVVLSHIWVANSSEGTVSKINTVTGVEEGRYRTGPNQSSYAGPDPSRTTVGLDGDVVVANRMGSSAVRIHADPATCPDKNGDGIITTSTGPTDVKPWGEDECVLWYRPFEQNSLARAAAFDFESGLDGELSSNVWIGLYSTHKVVKLDARTGEILAEVSIPGYWPYGMAFDGQGNLWVQGCTGLVRINTRTLEWDARPIRCGYGIAVDEAGNVWTNGAGCIGRYTPATDSWEVLANLTGNYGAIALNLGGIAVDGAGSVWAADVMGGAFRVDAATVKLLGTVSVSGGCKGMAVDFHGKVWCISLSAQKAYRIDPGDLSVASFPTGQFPYTYSDMTGFQLKNAAPPAGFYRSTLTGCGTNQEWLELSWTADTPPGTQVRFRARTANTPAELGSKPFVLVATQPSDTPPIDLRAKLEGATPGSATAALLQLEVVLSSTTRGVTPTLSNVRVAGTCPLPPID